MGVRPPLLNRGVMRICGKLGEAMNSRARLLAMSACFMLMFLPTSLPSVESPPGFVRVVNITPPPGSKVDAGTVIKAELEYRIQEYEPKTTHYALAPLFENAEGGGPFNHLARAMDGKVLREEAGTVKVTLVLPRFCAHEVKLVSPWSRTAPDSRLRARSDVA